jgi:hypothetical protein
VQFLLFVNVLKFEKGDWGLVLKFGSINMIEKIDLIHVSLHFIATHTIQSFVQRENLD